MFSFIQVVRTVQISIEKPSLPTIASCHRAAFPTSLSSLLGQCYVERMFSWYLSTSKTYLFQIEVEGCCIGYCGAMVVDGSWPAGSISSVLRYSLWDAVGAWLLRPWLWFNPKIWEKWPLVWKNLRYRVFSIKNQPALPIVEKPDLFLPSAGLIVIGVHPAYQGKGYGAALLREFERRAVEDYGIRRFHLSVRADNQQAIRAYERAGWQRSTTKNNSLSMWKELPDSYVFNQGNT